MDEIILKVSWSSESGAWDYNVYAGDEAYIACEASDGGVCTSTLEAALDMAVDDAKRLIRSVAQ